MQWIVERMRAAWREGALTSAVDTGARPHEAGLLRLDTARVRAALGWRSVLTLGETIDWIVAWHNIVGSGSDLRGVTLGQIAHYARRSGTKAIAA